MNYITQLAIDRVRHLRGVAIPLSERQPHIILTGRNGSGKTSVLRALELTLLLELASDGDRAFYAQQVGTHPLDGMFDMHALHLPKDNEIMVVDQREHFQDAEHIEAWTGIRLSWQNALVSFQEALAKGTFLFASYDAERTYRGENVRHADRVQLKESYAPFEKPGQAFIQMLVDMKMREALYRGEGETAKAENIRNWFARFTKLMRRIFGDPELTLAFDIETFAFHILEKGHEPFSFSELSSGYAAVFDIVTDLIVRMEKTRSGNYDLPGIVLIDEIEAHLHLALQKDILPILTELFPRIQFIVTTHSPFVLGSIKNAVLYDLETHTLVDEAGGLTDVPYSGIVEGYFGASDLSAELQEKYERFQTLAKKEVLTDDDCEELGELETYLDKIPPYLAWGIMADYQQAKTELEQKMEAQGDGEM